MQIVLNGKSYPLDNISTLENIIQQFCKNNKHVIAELNGIIIKSQCWPETPIKNNDHIELVSIVGGG
jgi:thiamine biosynthesis protein ThiS